MESITSLKNPKVVLWRSLKDRKSRKESGLFLVEGRRMTEEALHSGFPVHAFLLQEGAAPLPALPESIPCYILPEHVMAAVCDTKTPQGYAAVLAIQEWPLKGPRILALDDVQDPGNVGTMLRTADCAGFSGLLLSPLCADVYGPKALRSSMGSIFRMPVEVTPDLPCRLKRLRQEGYCIIASMLDGEPFYQHPPTAESFVLIIGNEGKGISPAAAACADLRLKLPMRGGAESLNAAVAAGIMMYELTRALPTA